MSSAPLNLVSMDSFRVVSAQLLSGLVCGDLVLWRTEDRKAAGVLGMALALKQTE